MIVTAAAARCACDGVQRIATSESCNGRAEGCELTLQAYTIYQRRKRNKTNRA